MSLDYVLDTMVCVKVVALLVVLPVTVIPEISFVLIPELVRILWVTVDEYWGKHGSELAGHVVYFSISKTHFPFKIILKQSWQDGSFFEGITHFFFDSWSSVFVESKHIDCAEGSVAFCSFDMHEQEPQNLHCGFDLHTHISFIACDRFVSSPSRFDFFWDKAFAFDLLFVFVYNVLRNIMIEQGLGQVSRLSCHI